MPSESANDAPDLRLNEDLRLVVTFRFEEQWDIGRVSQGNSDTSDTRLRIPAGGGLTPRPGIVIAPVHLKSLSPADVAKIIRQRVEDMALLAEAMTIANIQFREALESISPASAAAEPNVAVGL